jgi:hypothetical protein
VSCQKRAALPQNQDFLKRKEKKLVQNNLIFNLKKGTRTRIKKVATTAVQLQRRDLLGGAVSLKFLTHVERVEFSRFLKNELVYPLRNFPSEFNPSGTFPPLDVHGTSVHPSHIYIQIENF